LSVAQSSVATSKLFYKGLSHRYAVMRER